MSIYLIDPRGGVKGIDRMEVENKLNNGWIKLPQKELTIEGKPRQIYYPQFDNYNINKEKSFEEDDNNDILKVEIF